MMKSLIPCCEYILRMCHRIGRPPISTIGFGRVTVSSLSRVPSPPANMTAFIRFYGHNCEEFCPYANRLKICPGILLTPRSVLDIKSALIDCLLERGDLRIGALDVVDLDRG